MAHPQLRRLGNALRIAFVGAYLAFSVCFFALLGWIVATAPEREPLRPIAEMDLSRANGILAAHDKLFDAARAAGESKANPDREAAILLAREEYRRAVFGLSRPDEHPYPRRVNRAIDYIIQCGRWSAVQTRGMPWNSRVLEGSELNEVVSQIRRISYHDTMVLFEGYMREELEAAAYGDERDAMGVLKRSYQRPKPRLPNVAIRDEGTSTMTGNSLRR